MRAIYRLVVATVAAASLLIAVGLSASPASATGTGALDGHVVGLNDAPFDSSSGAWAAILAGGVMAASQIDDNGDFHLMQGGSDQIPAGTYNLQIIDSGDFGRPIPGGPQIYRDTMFQVVITPGSTTHVTRTLQRLPTVSGTIRSRIDKPISPALSVSLKNVDSGDFLPYVVPGPDGSFKLTAPAGNYKLVAQIAGTTYNYRSTWFPSMETESESPLIQLDYDQAVTDKDVTLLATRPGYIAGHVSGPNGAALKDSVWVNLLDSRGRAYGNVSVGRDGRFVMRPLGYAGADLGIEPGTYRLVFFSGHPLVGGGIYADKYWRKGTSFATATPITITQENFRFPNMDVELALRPNAKPTISLKGSVPKSIRKRVKAKLPTQTTKKTAVRWTSLTPKTCKIANKRVVGKKKGSCKLLARAKQTPVAPALKRTYTLRITR